MVIFFFNDTATTEIYTLSLHDALPIFVITPEYNHSFPAPLKSAIDWHFTEWQAKPVGVVSYGGVGGDRKSTRLNSSHANISYAVFCLKKKKTYWPQHPPPVS